MKLQATKKEFSFTIDTKPIAKARPRLGRFGNVYTPKKTKNAELLIRNLVFRQIKEPLLGALGVRVKFVFAHKKKTGPHVSRPDADNLIKTVLDALNGIAFKDDAQVCELFICKEYGKKDQIHFSVYELLS